MRTGLSAKILDELKNAIIYETYPIGSKLPTERELALHYGANRFAVREAIAMLSQNGFVETLPQSGTYVKDFYTDGSLDTLVQVLRVRRTIDRQTLESLLQFRTTIETSAAAEAAARITTDDVGYLADNLKQKEASLNDINVLTECDYAFHYKIIQVSGNTISKLVFQSFQPIYAFFTSFFYSLPDAAATSLSLNKQLLNALREGDRQASAAAMEAVLVFGRKELFSSINEREKLIVFPKE